jgi:phosphoglycolate phosphatase
MIKRVPVLSKITDLIFDLDGTLVDSIPGIGSSLREAFLSVGRKMPLADLRAAIGPPISIIAQRLEPELSYDEIVQIERHYRSSYDNEGWRSTPLFPGVAETLHTCVKRGYRLFIVTNKPRIPTKKILQYLKLESLFEEIVTRDSRSPAYASKADMLQYLLEKHALTLETTVMVGDTIEDCEAAQFHHLPFIYVAYGYGSVASPQFFVERFADLQNLIGTDPLHQEEIPHEI